MKEIEEALLARDVDLAVHSSKDMPVVLPEGLQIGAVLPREDARDASCLASRPGDEKRTSIGQPGAELGREPRIGTSSVRRSAQLTRVWPTARFLPVRGNLNTRSAETRFGRLRRTRSRVGGSPAPSARASDLDSHYPSTPACRRRVRGSSRSRCAAARTNPIRSVVVASIQHEASATALIAERALVVRLGGGCQMPIGAYATMSGGSMSMTAIVVSLDGARTARAEATGDSDNPHRLGVTVAERLLADGADDILADVHRAQAPVEGLQP